jgi:4-amino-4-deoxy-L-arabinose transferase-like glycosyltransferase
MSLTSHEATTRPDRSTTVAFSPRDWVGLGIVVSITFLLTAWNLGGAPRYFEDEGTYTSRAWSVFELRLDPYWYMFDHTPLGWMQMAPFVALFDVLGLGDGAVRTTRIVSLLALMACAGLLYLIARRMRIDRAIAVAAILVFAASPLTQELMRRVYLDNIAVAWALLAFALALGEHDDERYGLAGAALGIAVLSKITMLILAPALVVAVLTNARRERRLSATLAAAIGGALVAVTFPLWSLFTGRFPDLVAGTVHQVTRHGSGSLFDSGSPRHAVVGHWLGADQTFIVVGLVAALLVLALSARHRWVGVAALLPLVQILREGGYLPGMYVIFMLPFFTLAIAVCAQAVWDRLRSRSFLDSAQTRRIAGFTAVALIVVAVAPVMADRLQAPLYRSDLNENFDQGVQWILDNTSRAERIMVDDVAFASLRRSGRHDPWRHVVNVYKLDLDPLAAAALPDGWREFDYILDTPVLRGSLSEPALVQARTAYTASSVVATFGEGDFEVQVRRVRTWE